MQIGMGEGKNKEKEIETRKHHHARTSQLRPKQRPSQLMRETVVYQLVSFEKGTAAIINLKQTQVMQVGIQSTKRSMLT